MANDLIQIETPSTPAIVAELAPLIKAAKKFNVTDVVTNTTALERIQQLRRGEKRIKELFEEPRRKADEAKKSILSLRDGLIGPLVEARGIYDRKADAYEVEEQRKAKEQERQLQARANKVEEERQLMDAIDAEERGDTVQRDSIMQEEIVAPVVTVAPQIATVKGVSKRVTWSAEVHDLYALVEYVVAHPEWLSLIEPAMPKLNGLAIAQHEAMRIPGVRAVKKSSRAS